MKVRHIFINYIKRARVAGNRTETVKELKKMIAFNTLVVTELVADIKGESSDTSSEEPVKEETKQVEENNLKRMRNGNLFSRLGKYDLARNLLQSWGSLARQK